MGRKIRQVICGNLVQKGLVYVERSLIAFTPMRIDTDHLTHNLDERGTQSERLVVKIACYFSALEPIGINESTKNFTVTVRTTIFASNSGLPDPSICILSEVGSGIPTRPPVISPEESRECLT